MGYAIAWMKSVQFVFALVVSLLMLSACDEQHPDNIPGAVNNPYPTISVEASSSIQFSDSDSSITHSIPVIFDVAAPVAGTIKYRVVEGTAKAVRDYTSAATEVAFAKGDRQAAIELEVLNDAGRNVDRSFRVELLPSQYATLGDSLNYTVSIVAREDLDEPGESQSQLTIPTSLTFVAPVEGEENYAVVLPLSERIVNDAEVTIATQAGTAREGIHYRAISGEHCTAGVCTIAAGEQELVFTLPIIGMAERGSKGFKLQFISSTGIELSQNREVDVTLNYSGELEVPTLTPPNQLSLRMPSVERGNITYPVILPLSGMLQQEAKLEWRTVGDTAIAGTHYRAVDATGDQAQAIAAGQQEIEIELQLQHDQATTEDTGFQIQLVSADGINLPSERTIYVNIPHSNAGAPSYPRISFPNKFVVHEPAAGKKDVRLNLALTEALKEAAELSVRLHSETADLGVDYELPNAQLFFPRGSNEVAIPIRLLANNEATETQTFTVELHSPLNVSLPRDPTFTVDIIEQIEPAPSPYLTLSPYFIRVPVPRWNVPEDITLYFQLSEEAPGASVNVQSRNGTAKAGVDFVQTIQASVHGGQVNVDMTLLPQDLADTPREFELVFSDANGLTLPENRLVTIQLEPTATPALPSVIPPKPIDEDSPYPVVSFTAPSVGGDKKRRLVLPFSNVAPLAGTLTVISENGSAAEGADYTVTSYSPSFSIGAQEVVVELELEPSASGKAFRIILESAENLVLPSVFEERIIDVRVQ